MDNFIFNSILIFSFIILIANFAPKIRIKLKMEYLDFLMLVNLILSIAGSLLVYFYCTEWFLAIPCFFATMGVGGVCALFLAEMHKK